MGAGQQKPRKIRPLPGTRAGINKTIEIFLTIVREAFLRRAALHTEMLALHQQVAVLKWERPRPSLRMVDRVYGRPVSPVAGLVRDAGHRQARNRYRLAPKRVPTLLDLEVAANKFGAPASCALHSVTVRM